MRMIFEFVMRMKNNSRVCIDMEVSDNLVEFKASIFHLENGIMPTRTIWCLHGEKKDFDIEYEINEEVISS